MSVETGRLAPDAVRDMFDRIAPVYDFMNRAMSLGLDVRWRRMTAHAVVHPGDRVLDVCCGTGDLALAVLEAAPAARVVGIDFCRPMLELAARKAGHVGRRVPFVEGDALRLPFADGAFDGVCIGFGLRNLASVEEGLREIRRVLAPGGAAAILEFSKPVVPGFRALFQFYFSRLLPAVGGLLSGSRAAYEYLPDSVRNFPDQERLAALMREAGFEQVSFENLTGGIAALHVGRRGA
jgi:demethylmenaquinone methyltransferase/2-methoxy-6-polyprenyl-1,4-benzoquinol methylase